MADERAIKRRHLIGGLAALGTSALFGSAATHSDAQPARRMIDVHHHVVPPGWLQLPGGTPDEARVFKNWSVAHALEEMDRQDLALGYASITVPGKRFDEPADARRLSRLANDFMSQLRRDHPGRFGVLALVPMPDVEATLAEIAYAYDTLKVDGIGLFTSYGNTYIGDPSFDPVFAELNRRNAVVFVHPVSGPCCGALQRWMPTALIEFGTDTTRAIVQYVFLGASQRFPNVKMIWSHAGGTMPYLVQRFINAGNENMKARVPNGFLPEVRKFYYDTAQVPSRGTMQALRAVVPVSQIVFGTDYPYRTFDWTADLLERGNVFSAAELTAIYRGDATKLFQR